MANLEIDVELGLTWIVEEAFMALKYYPGVSIF
jgi:hypothetical protein